MKNVLFLIQAAMESENYDLFVMADNESEAIATWRRYYGVTGKPDRLVLVPVNAKPGAVAWNLMVQVVYDKQARKSACLTIEHDTKAREAIAAATIEPVTLAVPVHLAVVLEGGLVQCLVSNAPEAFAFVESVTVIDYDTEGADQIAYVRQADGSYSDACISGQSIDLATIDLEEFPEEIPISGMVEG